MLSDSDTGAAAAAGISDDVSAPGLIARVTLNDAHDAHGQESASIHTSPSVLRVRRFLGMLSCVPISTSSPETDALPHIRGRKWKRLHVLQMRYPHTDGTAGNRQTSPVLAALSLPSTPLPGQSPIISSLSETHGRSDSHDQYQQQQQPPAFAYFDEALPEVLEGRVSNLVFATRIRQINLLLAAHHGGDVRDTRGRYKNVTKALIVVVAIAAVAIALRSSATGTFAVAFLTLSLWCCVDLLFKRTPKYERDVQAMCEDWTQQDTPLRIGYVSQRLPPRASDSLELALRSVFAARESDWLIYIADSVAVLPTSASGATINTYNSAYSEQRRLPPYVPNWDITPAPEYDSNAKVEIPPIIVSQ